MSLCSLLMAGLLNKISQKLASSLLDEMSFLEVLGVWI